MNILISGANGLIGSALATQLTAAGHRVGRLTRRPNRPDDLGWDPGQGIFERSRLGEFDGVVHLAGEPVAGMRWTAEKKARIRDSRVEGTRLLAEALAGLDKPPRVLISASAIGYYGDRGDEVLDESSRAGTGFLADVAQAWEAAAQPAAAAGIRVVNPRFGVALSPAGGALKQMLTPFRLGAGGRIGSGKQFVSWIALDDVVGALALALETDALSGPVNVVAPGPVTNAEFTRELGAAVGRPTLLPVPAAMLRLALGEMSELLTASQRVLPRKLQEQHYSFRFPRLDAALRHLLTSAE